MRLAQFRRGLFGTALVALPLFGALSLMQAHSEQAVAIDAPKLDAAAPKGDGLQTAVLAGGCFWGIQAVYQHTTGVTSAVSGYAGGTKNDADYRMVSAGLTDHAEAVQVTYDPRVISYGKILKIFFSVAHNPTELDRQGPDVGTHYRSEIFPQSDEQRKIAAAYVAQLDAAKSFPEKIVTKINAGKPAFFQAEAYHQDYALKHPDHPYIIYNDAPKVENLKRVFPDVFREKPVTVAAR